jgi:N6-L-threonylcarbamoyladenine synthase
VTSTIEKSGFTVDDLDAIAVTNRPGLPLSLTVGVRYAKHLARKQFKPIIPIHHMEAHALMARMTDRSVQFPFLCLLISGGHTLLAYVKSVTEFYLLGESIDDAIGEAFDKTARLLKLRNVPEYEWLSGGAALEMAASKSKNPDRYEFPLPIARYRDCQFSFAGLKNNAKRFVDYEEKSLQLSPIDLPPYYEDFCAGFLKACTRHVLHRTQRAIEFCDRKDLFRDVEQRTLVISGGVACNNFIFEALSQMADQFGFRTVRPIKSHCTDNGIMIAWNGVERFMINSDLTTNYGEIRPIGRCPLGTSWIKQVTDTAIACKWVKTEIMTRRNRVDHNS